MTTPEHIQKFTSPCKKSITLNVHYDLEKLTFLNTNVTSICSKLGLDYDDTKILGSQLKALSRKRKPDKKVKFGNKKEYGRLNTLVASDKSYVSITRPVRQFLVRDFATDIDITNCHLEFIQTLWKYYKKENNANLEYWNNERENIFQTCIKQSSKSITRDDTKKLGFTFLYQGSTDKRFKELGLDTNNPELVPIYDLVKELTKDCHLLANQIKKDYPDVWKKLPYDPTKHNDRIDVGKFSCLMQNIERLCVEEIHHTAETIDINIIDFCHDGVLASYDNDILSDELADQLCQTAMKNIHNKLGLNLKICKKSMDNPLSNILDKWFLGDNDMNKCEVDLEKIKLLVPDTKNLNLNNFKKGCKYLAGLNIQDIIALGELVVAKYFIRVGDKWFMINRDTGLWNHTKPLSKEAFSATTLGTILECQISSNTIPIYQSLVFKDPLNVQPGEYNTYYKEMLYDRDNTEKLTEDELELIQPWIYHQKEVMCSNDESVYQPYIGMWKAKLEKPFEVNNNSRCLVLHGTEGSGKTTHITDLIQKLFGVEFVNGSVAFKSATKSDGFTDALENCLIGVMNEIPEYDFNHSTMYENFKSMITDNRRRSRRMFMGETAVTNTLMYILTTNNRNAIPISQNDRRYFFLSVSAKHTQDIPYFRKLGTCIQNHWALIARYILSFNADSAAPLPIPETSLRKHAKLLKLDSIGNWLQYKLTATDWIPDGEHLVKDMYQDYKDWCIREPIRSYTRHKFIGKMSDKYNMDKIVKADNRQALVVGDYLSFCAVLGWSGEKDFEIQNPN